MFESLRHKQAAMAEMLIDLMCSGKKSSQRGGTHAVRQRAAPGIKPQHTHMHLNTRDGQHTRTSTRAKLNTHAVRQSRTKAQGMEETHKQKCKHQPLP